jgi:hypothetical protein
MTRQSDPLELHRLRRPRDCEMGASGPQGNLRTLLGAGKEAVLMKRASLGFHCHHPG